MATITFILKLKFEIFFCLIKDDLKQKGAFLKDETFKNAPIN